jgi:hypothetical protein
MRRVLEEDNVPLIDSRGRLFGRLNLIDATVGLFVLVLIPLAYGAFLLFRVPAPTIVSIEPAEVRAHQPSTLRITGQDLRPFLRAHLGEFEVSFLVQSPTEAEIKVPMPGLDAGIYDLALFDEGQPLVRKPGAVTVVAGVSTAAEKPIQLQAVGRFVGLSNHGQAVMIRLGSKFASSIDGGTPNATAEVVALAAPEVARRPVRVAAGAIITTPAPGAWDVRAILRLTCLIANDECRMGATVLLQGETVTLAPVRALAEDPEPPERYEYRFWVQEILPGDQPTVLR